MSGHSVNAGLQTKPVLSPLPGLGLGAVSVSQGLRLGLFTVATSVAEGSEASVEATVTSQGRQPLERKLGP